MKNALMRLDHVSKVYPRVHRPWERLQAFGSILRGPYQALREIGRVLKPGSRFHFVEHGRSSDPDVARWQDHLTPIHRLYSGGCHLNRQIDVIIQEAGFELEQLEKVYMCGPRVGSYLYKGRAVGRG